MSKHHKRQQPAQGRPPEPLTPGPVATAAGPQSLTDLFPDEPAPTDPPEVVNQGTVAVAVDVPAAEPYPIHLNRTMMRNGLLPEVKPKQGTPEVLVKCLQFLEKIIGGGVIVPEAYMAQDEAHALYLETRAAVKGA